jgi:uncharacterized membrane protein YcgQ (UPF0703/DUF1980 family)
MAFNPFAAKPEVDHSKVIRHFAVDFRDLKASKDALSEDIEGFMSEVVQQKAELVEMMQDETVKSNAKMVEQYQGYIASTREDIEQFKEDIQAFQVAIDDTLKKTKISKEKMSKEDARKFSALTEMVGTGKKFMKRMEGITSELNSYQKKVAEI